MSKTMSRISIFASLAFLAMLWSSEVHSLDILDHHLYCPDIRQVCIPETELKTRTFYTLILQSFPNGVITYTGTAHKSGSRFVEIDNFGSSDYKPGGKWYADAQWTLIPSSLNPGWYFIMNRGRPGEYLSLVPDSDYTYMVLTPNHLPQTDDTFLFKPVRHGSENAYQIKSKTNPKAVVTSTMKKYQGDSRYVQLDGSENSKYLEGGEWFKDTLFSFTEATK